MKKKLYALYDWKKAIGIIGLIGISSIVIGSNMAGLILIFMAVINFVLLLIDDVNIKKQELKKEDLKNETIL